MKKGTNGAVQGFPKTIVFLAAPNTQILDVAGPFQVFVRAAELFGQEHPGRERPYNVVLASTSQRKNVSTNCGLALTVCGMEVDPTTAPKTVYKGKTYYFMTEQHKQQFEANPQTYIGK
jgi:YHS domain-containing protein